MKGVHVFYNFGRWWVAEAGNGALLAGPMPGRGAGERDAKAWAESLGYTVAHTGFGTRDDLHAEFSARIADERAAV